MGASLGMTTLEIAASGSALLAMTDGEPYLKKSKIIERNVGENVSITIEDRSQGTDHFYLRRDYG